MKRRKNLLKRYYKACHIYNNTKSARIRKKQLKILKDLKLAKAIYTMIKKAYDFCDVVWTKIADCLHAFKLYKKEGVVCSN